MSEHATRWARKQRVGNSIGKALLMSLACACDRSTWQCMLTVNELAEQAEMSERSAIRHLKVLADLGLIEIRERYDRTGCQLANEYALLGSRGGKV